MCTPVGHSLAGLALFYATGNKSAKEDTRRLGWFILLANLPDFDFIPGILIGDPGRFHHGVTHSIGFVLLIAFMAWLWGKPALANNRFMIFNLSDLLVGSHLLIDWLTWDPPGNDAQCIPLFWPWSDASFLSPITIFNRVERQDLLSYETLSNNLSGLVIETAVLLPFVLLARWMMLQRINASG